MSFKCPRCGTNMTAPPDPQGFVSCPSCGVRVRPQVPAGPSGADIQALVAEVRALRRMQGEILQYQAQVLTLLKAQAGERDQPGPIRAEKPPAAPSPKPEAVAPGPRDEKHHSTPAAVPPPLPRVRQRRKTVLIVDDDDAALQEAVAAMEQAQVPVRTAADGNAAVAAIAAEKPDVLVLELGIQEPMPGTDLVNVVKATMEWVDLPIVLYTREAVESQQEARTQHGADEVVIKGPGSADALVNRVVRIFQGH